MENFRYLKDLKWEEVFDQWRKNESEDEGWQRAAQEHGWPDWEHWRSYLSDKALALPTREWKLYGIDDPLTALPNFLVGPFDSWQQSVPEDKINKITFGEYLELDRERWQTHDKIQSLLTHFPTQTQIIGLVKPETNQIVCIEGTHRSMAVTRAWREGIQLPAGITIELALAHIGDQERDLLWKALYLGTHKPS